ncbi:MAG: hypothetical protein FJ387_02100 [Verrucomicrobia bacterium]|nr:hypothetical protein [Verrucomicrobiota bacterium]
MKAFIQNSMGKRRTRGTDTKPWFANPTRWPTLASVHLAWSVLTLGLLPLLHAQTIGPEEYTFTTLAGPPESPGAMVTTLAGNASILDERGWPVGGFADGTGSAARFYLPSGVAVDSAGNVYATEVRNATIRKVTPSGVVTTLAGRAEYTGSADGTGSVARFYGPQGAAVDNAGNLYVADSANHTIRKVTPAGVVTTLAGDASIANQYGFPAGGSVDGTGGAARFSFPWSVAVDNGGNVYVADRENCTIRKVTPDGVVTTLAGSAGERGSASDTSCALATAALSIRSVEWSVTPERVREWRFGKPIS